MNLLLCFLPLLSALASVLDPVPRRFVPYDSDNNNTFQEKGVFDYSTMMLREDLGLLMVGASGMVYALDLNDISKKNDSVKWDVTLEQAATCDRKSINPTTECRNQIKTLLKKQDGRMLVCGTNALKPQSDYMSYMDGNLTLEGNNEVSVCPHDPSESSASLMIGDDVYSAVGEVFSKGSAIKTSQTSFFDPTFVSMEMMPESENSDTGDDDKIYLFFSEKAVEYDYKTMHVSRVARVCKGDHGGRFDLLNKWTSFVKARLECPVPGCKGTSMIQDTFRWCDPQQDWKSCLFFAVFTSQTCSAVCVYSVTDISRVFSEGTFMIRYSDGWMPNKDPLPVPRPGSCIDNAARKAGINDSRRSHIFIVEDRLDLPIIIKEAIEPLGGKAMMLKGGGEFRNIIIDQVQTTDGDKHHVMFIGTNKGTILKAVNYGGEIFIIEEVQVFKTSEPIKILKFSNVTRQIYAGSDSGVVQVSLSSCGRSLTCMDCVLARDPYCGWDHAAGKCSALSATQRELLQSVKEGNASLCPKTEPQTERKNLTIPGYLKLLCSLESKLATMRWEKDKSTLVSSPHRLEQQDGLLILEVSKSDTGHYRCLSVMSSKDAEYKTTVAQYNVTIEEKTVEIQPQQYDYALLSLQIGLALVFFSFCELFIWNFCKGHIGFPCKNKQPRAVADHSCQACTNSHEQVDNNQDNGDNVSTHV